MTLGNAVTGAFFLAAFGTGGYFMHISSLVKHLEPISPADSHRYLVALEKHHPHETADAVKDGGSEKTHLTFAYRAPTVLPTNRDLGEVFGKAVVERQASYVAADGGKKVGSVFSEKKGNEALGALFALQALEKSTPQKQLRAAALFRGTFKISAQYHYMLHNRRAAMGAAREVVATATTAADATRAAEEYCFDVAALTGERGVAVSPALRFASMQGECNTAVGIALEPTLKEKPTPREAGICVVSSIPIPAGVAEGSYEFLFRKTCGDWYTRWLAVKAAQQIPHL